MDETRPPAILGPRPVRVRMDRAVFDLHRAADGFTLTLQGDHVACLETPEAALLAARRRAAALWREGQPTIVRWVNEDRTLTPIVSYG